MSDAPEIADPIEARLAALRSAGAGRLDPFRFRALEALARGLASQPEAVRALLQERLASALAGFEARVTEAPAPRPAPATARVAGPAQRPAPCPPLADLNAHLRHAAAARAATEASGHDSGPADELASARRFRQAWQASRTVEQVAQALHRKPSNAGPLNSHALVVHSLRSMLALSPEYLARFLVQVESLQWLEQAALGTSQAKPRSVAHGRRRGRSRGA